MGEKIFSVMVRFGGKACTAEPELNRETKIFYTHTGFCMMVFTQLKMFLMTFSFNSPDDL